MTLPVSVDSNVTGLSIAEELSLKVLPGVAGANAVWYGLEPNTYSDFGADFTSVARKTINNTRQVLRGTITDESAKAGFNIDMTAHNLQRLLQGFAFADAIEKPCTNPLNGTQIPLTSLSTTQFLAASGLGTFLVNHLVEAKGLGVSGNNGLAHITVVAAGALTTDKVLVAEASPPAGSSIEAVGIRGAAGDLKISIVGSTVRLASTALNFTTLGLTVGEWVFIGGDAAINRFVTSASAAVNVGYARISAIAANLLTFDLTSFVPALDLDAGGLQKIDVYFGKIIANAANPTNIKRRSYQLERTMGNDGVAVQAEYLTGAVPDQLTLNLQQASKVTMDMSFVGLDVEERDGTLGVKVGSHIAILGEPPFNTSHDVFLSRLAIVDPTTLNPIPLFAYASDIKLVINNGIAPTKAIGVQGGFNVSAGDFDVSGTLTAYFQSVDAVLAIKNNSDFGLQTIFARANGGVVFDLPLLTLGGGTAKVEKDKPIMVDLTQAGAKNIAGYTFMATFFEYLPTVAMPV